MAALPSGGRAAAIGVPHEPAAADATHALYERYGQQIYRFCLQRLRNREEAEDAAQTTFLNAFRSLERGVSVEFESAWLYKIALHVCLTKHRSSNLRRLVEAPSDTDAIEEQVPAHEQDTDELFGLDAALRLMPDQQRRAFLLREWQGLSYKEIGDELRLSQSAVETLLFRARRSLADALVHDPNERRGRGRPRKLTSLSSAIGLVKPLLLGGGAKVVAVVATVAATSVVATAPAVRRQLIDAIAPSPARPARHLIVRRSLNPATRPVRALLATTASPAPAPAPRAQRDPDVRLAAASARKHRIVVEPTVAPAPVVAPSAAESHIVAVVSAPVAPVSVSAPETVPAPAPVDPPVASDVTAGQAQGPVPADPAPAPPAPPVASTATPGAPSVIPNAVAPTTGSIGGSPTVSPAPAVPVPSSAPTPKAPITGAEGSVRSVQSATIVGPVTPAPVVQSIPPSAPVSLAPSQGPRGSDTGAPARVSVPLPPVAQTTVPSTVKTQFVLGSASAATSPAPTPGTNGQPLQVPDGSGSPAATVTPPPLSQGTTPTSPTTATAPTTTTPTVPTTVTAAPATSVVAAPYPIGDDWSGHGNGNGHGRGGRQDS